MFTANYTYHIFYAFSRASFRIDFRFARATLWQESHPSCTRIRSDVYRFWLRTYPFAQSQAVRSNRATLLSMSITVPFHHGIRTFAINKVCHSPVAALRHLWRSKYSLQRSILHFWLPSIQDGPFTDSLSRSTFVRVSGSLANLHQRLHLQSSYIVPVLCYIS